MAQITVKLSKNHVSVPATIHFDFERPEPQSGYRGGLDLVRIDMYPHDAMELIPELIRAAVENALWNAWDHDYLDGIQEVEL